MPETTIEIKQQSILQSVKKLLGLAETYTAFDMDVVIHINTFFGVLQSLGATPPNGFRITGSTEKWGDFLIDDEQSNMALTYIYLRIRPVFDPAANSFTQESQAKVADELGFRLSMLELAFNPNAWNYIVEAGTYDEAAVIWTLDSTHTFPPEAPEGALGLDPDGNVWRKG